METNNYWVEIAYRVIALAILIAFYLIVRGLRQRLNDTPLKKYTNPWWVTAIGFVVLSIAYGTLSGQWLSAFVLLPITLSALMTIFYFTALELAASDTILTSGDTETFGLAENNGDLREIISFSDQYHVRVPGEAVPDDYQDWNKWDILPGPAPKSWLEEEINAQWLGMPWNRSLASVRLRCHRWNDDKNFIGGGTSEKHNHTFDRYFPLFHTHAYITDEIEIGGNFHVKGAFTFRFRITNPYLAFYQTSDVIFQLDAIAKDVTRELWATTDFEELKKAKFATITNTGEVTRKQLTAEQLKQMGYRLMLDMNDELNKYGIAIIDIHFVDLVNTRPAEIDALSALRIAELKGLAGVKTAELKAKEFDLETTALVRREKKMAEAVHDGNDGDPKAMMAYAVLRNHGLRAVGAGALVNIGDEPKPEKPQES